MDRRGRLMRVMSRGRARVANAVAWLGAGVSRVRRGSVLVLILGSLALLSVVTIVYVTVGQADRRAGAVIAERQSVANVVEGVATYIARDVIGADALAVFTDGGDPQLASSSNPGGAVLVREAFDYPATDYSLLTHLPGGQPAPPDRRFNPVGTYRDVPSIDAPDPRTPTDPWLASTEPTWLRSPSVPPPAGGGNPATEYLQFVDWAHISNINPSGNFVNLWNLRIGGFDAPAGFGPDGNPQQGDMSFGLSLLTLNGQFLGATQQLDFASRQADPLRPAHWDTRQVFAFRPDRDAIYGPEDVRYAPYQWADTDGDKNFDSRWGELVDVGDPRNPRSMLPRDDRYRWFVATRIIDLSGLINVNTSAEFRGAPGRAGPAGVTPADVDLRRVLRLDDVIRALGPRPSMFGPFTPPAPPFVPPAFLPLDRYTSTDYSGQPAGNAWAIGSAAYDSLRLAIRDAVAPWAPTTAWPYFTSQAMTADQRAAYFRQVGGHAGGGAGFSVTPGGARTFESGGMFGLADALELLTFWGINDSSRTSRLEQTMGGRADQSNGGTVDTKFLSPLRDNRDITLERDTRDDDQGGYGNGRLDDDALVLAAADVRRLLTTVSGGRLLRSGIVARGFEGTLDAIGDERIDAVAALETASGAGSAPKDAGALFAGYADALLPHSWRANAWNPAATSLRTLAYGRDPVLALWCAAAMTANAIDMYDRDASAGGGPASDRRAPSAFTLALSGVPADLQAIDANPLLFPYWTPRPAQGQPRIARPGSLDLDYALLLRKTNNDPGPLPPSRLARQNNLPPEIRALNVYGFEAQPFITQVASFTIYTDAPVKAYPAGTPNADEYVPPAGGPGFPPAGGQSNPINIRGAVVETNPDILCQVIAFQITNPFDARIGLGRGDVTTTPAGTALPDDYPDYYIEFGGRLYKLVEVDSAGTSQRQVVLDARDPAVGGARGNTRIFYALNDTLDAIQQRFERAALPGTFFSGSSFPPDGAKQVIERQLRSVLMGTPGGGSEPVPVDIDPILIPRMNPSTGQVETGFIDMLTTIGGNDAPDRVVKLWRKFTTPTNDPVDPRVDHMLADRLHDPSTGPIPALDRRLDPGQNDVANTVAGPDPTGPGGGTLTGAIDNTGYSICLWGSIKRPDDPKPPNTQRLPRGALPAYCVEVRGDWVGASSPSQNSFEPTPPPTGRPNLRKSHFTGSGLGQPISASVGDEYLWRGSGVGALYTKLSDPNIPPRIPTLVQWPEDKSGQPIGVTGLAGAQGQPLRYDEVYPEVHLNDARFLATPAGGGPAVVTMRAGDMLLPMAIAATRAPAATTVTPDQQWITFGEAMALALNYADVQASDPAFGFLNGLGGGQTLPQRPKVDRGQLTLLDWAPFEDVTGDGLYTPGVDIPRFPGVPLALRVPDMFRAVDPAFGSISSGVPGLININTAPRRVLLGLPLMQPTAGSTLGQPDWWGAGLLGNVTLPTINDDCAASLQAYRDKSEVTDAAGRPTIFTDPQPGTLDDPLTWSGRVTTNAIAASREAPGLLSFGEVLCATSRGAGVNNVPAGNRLDALGRDSFNSGAVGVDSTLYRLATAPSNSPPTEIDEIADDYDEQLAAATALSNSVNVRSDVFAVWFVLHGYQRSDVENLNNNDPLVPTVAKRYLMIVDRSNVTRLGDRPRILLMQELPM